MKKSRIRESDPPLQLGKLTYYRCTNPANNVIIYRKRKKIKSELKNL